MGKWTPQFKIEGIEMPIPDGYMQNIEDLSSEATGRNLAGDFFKDVIAIKSEIPLKWSRLEWHEAAKLANAIDGKSKLNVSYMDIRTPYVMENMSIYVGKRSFTPVEFATDGKVYWSIEFSEIEI